MAKAAPRRLTVRDVVILAVISVAFTVIYFSVIYPYIISAIPDRTLTTFNFRENEWFDAPNVMIVNNFRGSGPSVVNDELFYQIKYSNKKPFPIRIEPVLEIMYGGKVMDNVTDSALEISPNSSGQHRVRFFTNHIGENQLIFTARVTNVSDSSPFGVVQTTINIPIYSQEAAAQIEQNQIALFSIPVGFATIVGLIVSLNLSRRQADGLQKQNELMGTQFNRERKKKHFERLVDESMALWTYVPKSSGEMIHYRSDQIYETRLLPYLEQAKKHLESYPAIWKLYQDAPGLVKSKESHEEELKKIRQEIKNLLRSEIMKVDPKRELDADNLTSQFSDSIYEQLIARTSGQKKADFVARKLSNPKEYAIGDRVVDYTQDGTDITIALNAILHNQELYLRLEEGYKNVVSLQQHIETNRSEFTRLLQTEVIDKVRLGDFEHLEGKCNQCPKPFP
jgi:hypothetical protein